MLYLKLLISLLSSRMQYTYNCWKICAKNWGLVSQAPVYVMNRLIATCMNSKAANAFTKQIVSY